MNLLFLIIGSAVVLIAFVIGLFYLMMEDPKSRKKKKKDAVDYEKQYHQLKEKEVHLEKQIQSFHQEIASLQKRELAKDKELTLEKAKVKKLQEKILQEKEWIDKEQTTIDKRGKEIQVLKEELIKAHEQFSKEHGHNLKISHELKDVQGKLDALVEQKRNVDFERSQLEAKAEAQRKEIVELRKENMDLVRKKEDVSWIAKPEYDRIKQLLEEKEKELNRLKREEGAK